MSKSDAEEGIIRPLKIDVCLTGLLARSLSITLPGILSFCSQLSAMGNVVRIVVVAIDPEDTLVDNEHVSHDAAIKLLSSLLTVHHVHVIRQAELDQVIEETMMLKRYSFFICHGVSKPCTARHIPNIMRHILIERQCAAYLDSSDCDIAFSLSPDILIDTVQEQIMSALSLIMRTSSIIVPRCDAPKKYVVNGFAGGSRVSMIKFLSRDWLEDHSLHPTNAINFENMCNQTLRRIGAQQHMVDVVMTKIRANGATHKAWACVPIETKFVQVRRLFGDGTSSISTFRYGLPGNLMSIDGYLTARCERNVANNRLAYIGIGIAERASNFGCATKASAMADASVRCLQLSGTTKITLEHDSEYVINMDTGEHLRLESVGPETLERFRVRWRQAGYLEETLNAIAQQFPVISPKSWSEERVEQSMNMRFLRGTESVLELGACIGRNSLVIASILNEHGGRQVSVEANPKIVKQLKESQLASGLHFNIVDRPLSRQRMIVREWCSQCIGPKAKVVPGWQEVPTITLQDLKDSTGVNSFDTLVIDCEGAFYGIMNEFPEVLENVTKVLIENDSCDVKEAEAIHARLRQHGLLPIWSQRLDKSWAIKYFPKCDVFWQCWVKLA